MVNTFTCFGRNVIERKMVLVFFPNNSLKRPVTGLERPVSVGKVPLYQYETLSVVLQHLTM